MFLTPIVDIAPSTPRQCYYAYAHGAYVFRWPLEFWKFCVLPWPNFISQNLRARFEENNDQPQIVEPISELRFEPRTSVY